jgi:hypothetical protein
VCDLSTDYSEKCVKAFHKIRYGNAEVKSRCVGIGFADDEVQTGLQFADLVAYCARAEALRDAGIKAPHPLVEEIITLFRTQDIEKNEVEYRLQGNGLGDGKI